MAPITLGVQVTEVQAGLFSQRDVGNGSGDLSGDESSSSARTLVVEQNAIASVHSVRLPVVHGDPECVKFSDTVGGTGIEGCSLRLGSLDDFTIQLGC